MSAVSSLPLDTDTRCLALLIWRQPYYDVTRLCHVIQKDIARWLGIQWLHKSGLQFYHSDRILLAVWHSEFQHGHKLFDVKQRPVSDSGQLWAALPFPREVFGTTGVPLLVISSKLRQYGVNCDKLVTQLRGDKIAVSRNDVGDYVISCKLNDLARARDRVLQHVADCVALQLWGGDDIQVEAVYDLPRSTASNILQPRMKSSVWCDKSVRCAALTWLLWKRRGESELAGRFSQFTVTTETNDQSGDDVILNVTGSRDSIQWLETQLAQAADNSVVFSMDMSLFGSRRMQQFVKRLVAFKYDVIFAEMQALHEPSSPAPNMATVARQQYTPVTNYLSDLISQVRKTPVSAAIFLSLVQTSATFVTPTSTDGIPVVVVDPDGLYFYVPACDVIVYVTKGNIIRQRVDVIVSAADEGLSGRRGVARVVEEGGGEEVRQQCDELLMQQPSWTFAAGDVVVTSGGRLPYSLILHAVSPQWQQHGDTCRQLLCDTIVKCLAKAASLDATSIALPALSAGQAGVPKDIVASAMFESVTSFCTTRPHDIRKLRDIVIVTHSDDMLRATQRLFYLALTSSAPVTSSPVDDTSQSQATLRAGRLSLDGKGSVKDKKERGSKSRWYDNDETS